MKRDVTHLEKYRFVLETDEQKIMQQMANNQKKIDQEKHKHDMLNHCLIETKSNLQSQTQQRSIPSIQYQQYQHFIFQLEKALTLQNNVLDHYQQMHDKLVKMYQVLKVKIKNLQELIANIEKSNNYQDNRKENQENTEIVNRLKPYQ